MNDDMVKGLLKLQEVGERGNRAMEALAAAMRDAAIEEPPQNDNPRKYG
jgi:hypothetical protein